MANDVVRYVGDIVAVVVAETPAQAYDALELIDVDYEPLPAVVDPEQADAPGRAAAARGQSRAISPSSGRLPAATSTRRFKPPKSSSRSASPAAADSDGDGAARRRRAVSGRRTGELTLWNTTQNPHILRFIMSLGGDRRAGRQAARHRARSRRRVRQQDRADPGDFITVFCCDEARIVPSSGTKRAARTTSRRRTAAITCRKSNWRRPRTAGFSGCGRRSWAAMGAYLSDRGARHSDASSTA